MPKGKRKSERTNNRFDNLPQTSDDESLNDNASVISNISENKSADDDGTNDDFAQDQFEDKLLELLDGLTQKSTQGRTTCLDSLKKAFIKRYVPNFIRERHFTICDSIERSVKRGSTAEKAAAAELAPVICLQLGDEDAGDIIDKALRPVLLITACDKTVSAIVRAKCCLAVGILGFIADGELGDTVGLMQSMEGIFSGSYLKGDGSVPSVTPEAGNLHAAALSVWSLLLTVLPSGAAMDLLGSKAFPSLVQLSQLLESPHLEVRLTAGETLALIFEIGRNTNEEFEEEFADEFSETFRKMATDSNKYRGKKDRKQQRATFRDILQFIEEGITPECSVKFGKLNVKYMNEVIVLDTWRRRRQYESLCAILGPGINVHLSENLLLRSIFGITEPLLKANDSIVFFNLASERYQKRLMNAAASKARTITRGKNRDKRSDF